MNRWLARLAFSFFIVAGVLVYEGFRASRSGSDRAWLYFVGAVAFFLLGLRGLRERHRP